MSARYEEVRDIVRNLPRAPRSGGRSLRWVTERGVAVARTTYGQVEVFLPGPPLHASSPVVAAHLDHSTWYHDGQPFDANRVVIPHGPGYDQIAAVICTELADAGVDHDLAAAFAACEALIALALEPLVSHADSFLGLLGELITLRALLQSAPNQHLSHVLASWLGWKPSLRDFDLGTAAVEVKTTRRADSQHHLQGVYQAEPTMVDGAEEQLFMLSLGLQVSELDGTEEGTTSLAGLIGDIEERLARLPAADLEGFRTHVRDYMQGFGANPDPTSAWGVPYVVRFARLYDMNDPAVRAGVMQSSQISSSSYVVLPSVTYTLNLPPEVSGDLNPEHGPHRFAPRLLSSAGLD